MVVSKTRRGLRLSLKATPSFPNTSFCRISGSRSVVKPKHSTNWSSSSCWISCATMSGWSVADPQLSKWDTSCEAKSTDGTCWIQTWLGGMLAWTPVDTPSRSKEGSTASTSLVIWLNAEKNSNRKGWSWATSVLGSMLKSWAKHWKIEERSATSSAESKV